MQDVPDSLSFSPFIPFHGREPEIELVMHAADTALRGRTATTLNIVGSRGRGKSRLVDELLIRLPDLGIAPPLVLRAGFSNESPLDPLARILRQRFGVAEPVDEDLAKWLVRGELREILDDTRVDDFASVLVHLMGIRTSTPLLQAVDSGDRRGLDRGVLSAFLERDARSRPVVLIIEDLHVWPELQALVRMLSRGLRSRVLLIVTSREDVFAADPGQTRADSLHTVELGPLSADECAGIVRDHLNLDGGELPRELVEVCRALSGGSPGLLGQAFAGLESEGVFRRLSRPGVRPRFELHMKSLKHASDGLSVDEAVELRVAALEALELRILQHAASVGGVVWLGAVAAQELALTPKGTSLTDHELSEALAMLAERDFLLPMPDSSFIGEVEYVFKHNVEREFVLRTLTPRELLRRHLAVADWLECRLETAESPDHLVALGEHLEAAAMPERAAEAFFAAASVMVPNQSLHVVAELWKRGLKLLGDTHARRRVEVLHDYGFSLVAIGSLREALVAFQEMAMLAESLRQLGSMAAAHRGIGRVERDRGQLKLAREHLQIALDFFTDDEDDKGIAAVHDDLGRLEWLEGDYRPARAHAVRALELRSSGRDSQGIAASLDTLSLVGMDSGQRELAKEAIGLAMGLKRDGGDRLGVIESLHDLGRLAQQQDEHARALDVLLDALDFARAAHGYPYLARLLADVADSQRELGQLEAAEGSLLQAERLASASGDHFALGRVFCVEAGLSLKTGNGARARRAAESALRISNQVESRALSVAVFRALAEVKSAAATDTAGEEEAASFFVRAATLGKEIGNELEVASTYRAFARSAQRSHSLAASPEIHREAERLDAIADAIYAKSRIEFDDDEWFALRLAALATPGSNQLARAS